MVVELFQQIYSTLICYKTIVQLILEWLLCLSEECLSIDFLQFVIFIFFWHLYYWQNICVSSIRHASLVLFIILFICAEFVA